MLSDFQATEEALVEVFAAYKTQKWDFLAQRHNVEIPQDFRKPQGTAERLWQTAKQRIGQIFGRQPEKLPDSAVFAMLGKLEQSLYQYPEWKQVLERTTEQRNPFIRPTLSGSPRVNPTALANRYRSGGLRFDLNVADDSDFAKAVDDIANGGSASKKHITLGTTPEVLAMIGLPETRINIRVDTIQKAMGEHLNLQDHSHSHIHNLTPETLKQIPEQLNNPIAAMKSAQSSSNPNGFVVLTELTETDSKTGKDKPVVAILDLHPTNQGLEVITVRSVYGRSLMQVEKGLTNDLLYLHTTKGSQFVKDFGLRLPSDALSTANLVRHNVKTNEDLLQYRKDKEMQKIEERYYQNTPKDAMPYSEFVALWEEKNTGEKIVDDALKFMHRQQSLETMKNSFEFENVRNIYSELHQHRLLLTNQTQITVVAPFEWTKDLAAERFNDNVAAVKLAVENEQYRNLLPEIVAKFEEQKQKTANFFGIEKSQVAEFLGYTEPKELLEQAQQIINQNTPENSVKHDLNTENSVENSMEQQRIEKREEIFDMLDAVHGWNNIRYESTPMITNDISAPIGNMVAMIGRFDEKTGDLSYKPDWDGSDTIFVINTDKISARTAAVAFLRGYDEYRAKFVYGKTSASLTPAKRRDIQEKVNSCVYDNDRMENIVSHQVRREINAEWEEKYSDKKEQTAEQGGVSLSEKSYGQVLNEYSHLKSNMSKVDTDIQHTYNHRAFFENNPEMQGSPAYLSINSDIQRLESKYAELETRKMQIEKDYPTISQDEQKFSNLQSQLSNFSGVIERTKSHLEQLEKEFAEVQSEMIELGMEKAAVSGLDNEAVTIFSKFNLEKNSLKEAYLGKAKVLNTIGEWEKSANIQLITPQERAKFAQELGEFLKQDAFSASEQGDNAVKHDLMSVPENPLKVDTSLPFDEQYKQYQLAEEWISQQYSSAADAARAMGALKGFSGYDTERHQQAIAEESKFAKQLDDLRQANPEFALMVRAKDLDPKDMTPELRSELQRVNEWIETQKNLSGKPEQAAEVKHDLMSVPETPKTLTLSEQALKDGKSMSAADEKVRNAEWELAKQPNNTERQQALKTAQAERVALHDEIKQRVSDAMAKGEPFVIRYDEVPTEPFNGAWMFSLRNHIRNFGTPK